jgi:two-component system, OmpR family, response regulator
MGEVFHNHLTRMRLLIVEDDEKLVRALERGLEREGYGVEVARTGDEGLERAGEDDYDAVVLDLMLPGLDGVTLCQTLRRRGHWVPVLMLTARGEVGDRIRGLDSGADDYLVKPFDFGELLARLRALIRRGPSERPLSMEIGDLRIDPSTRIVTRAGHQVELTAREFDVLEVLARDAGRLVTRETLLESVWAGNPEGSPNVVDVYVGYLRRKIDGPGEPRLLHTVRGAGYVLRTEPP